MLYSPEVCRWTNVGLVLFPIASAFREDLLRNNLRPALSKVHENTLSIKFRSWSPANQAISKLFLFSASARFIQPARISSRSDYKTTTLPLSRSSLTSCLLPRFLFAAVWEDLNSKTSYVSIVFYLSRYLHLKSNNLFIFQIQSCNIYFLKNMH